MFCNSCGAKLPDEARFCSKCGALVAQGMDPAKQGDSTPRAAEPIRTGLRARLIEFRSAGLRAVPTFVLAIIAFLAAAGVAYALFRVAVDVVIPAIEGQEASQTQPDRKGSAGAGDDVDTGSSMEAAEKIEMYTYENPNLGLSVDVPKSWRGSIEPNSYSNTSGTFHIDFYYKQEQYQTGYTVMRIDGMINPDGTVDAYGPSFLGGNVAGELWRRAHGEGPQAGSMTQEDLENLLSLATGGELSIQEVLDQDSAEAADELEDKVGQAFIARHVAPTLKVERGTVNE